MKRTEVTVGAVILAGIVLLFFGTLWLKGSRLGAEETTITARFLEIGQLLEGTPGTCRSPAGSARPMPARSLRHRPV